MSLRDSNASLVQHFEMELEDPYTQTGPILKKSNRKKTKFSTFVLFIFYLLIFVILIISFKITYSAQTDLNHKSNILLQTEEKLNKAHAEKSAIEKDYFLERERKKKFSEIKSELSIAVSNGNKELESIKSEVDALVKEKIDIEKRLLDSEAKIREYTKKLGNLPYKETLDMIQDTFPNLADQKEEYEQLQLEYSRLKSIKKQFESYAPSEVLSIILNTHIMQNFTEYNTIINWIKEEDPNKDIFLVQKYKMSEESEEEIEKLHQMAPELCSSKKKMMTLVWLKSGERFGFLTGKNQDQLWNLKMSDDSSFFFSIDKGKKYKLKECQKNMKTTYILSFRPGVEIRIPDSCFEEDRIFGVEEKVKYYRAKKHFGVEKIEIYLIYQK